MKSTMSVLISAALLLGALSYVGAITVTVKSPGTVTATGNGMAHTRIFQGTVTICGQGRLRVSSTAQVQITAGTAGAPNTVKHRPGSKQSWVVYPQFNGTAIITGTDVHVFLHGKSISLSGQGAGRAHFIGTGSFTITTQGKPDQTGNWTPAPAKKVKGKAYLTFWNSIRLVYGDYDFPNGKEDEEGEAELP